MIWRSVALEQMSQDSPDAVVIDSPMEGLTSRLQVVLDRGDGKVRALIPPAAASGQCRGCGLVSHAHTDHVIGMCTLCYIESGLCTMGSRATCDILKGRLNKKACRVNIDDRYKVQSPCIFRLPRLWTALRRCAQLWNSMSCALLCASPQCGQCGSAVGCNGTA